MTGFCVFGIIINKLGHWEEPGPIVLLEIDKRLEVDFYNTVLSFALAVSLRMEGDEKPTLDIKEVSERLPEFWGE